MNLKDSISLVYYMIGAVAFVLAFIRILYGWFRDFDNANRFTSDMATVHLPFIYKALCKLAERFDIELEQSPIINFSTHESGHKS